MDATPEWQLLLRSLRSVLGGSYVAEVHTQDPCEAPETVVHRLIEMPSWANKAQNEQKLRTEGAD